MTEGNEVIKLVCSKWGLCVCVSWYCNEAIVLRPSDSSYADKEPHVSVTFNAPAKWEDISHSKVRLSTPTFDCSLH